MDKPNDGRALYLGGIAKMTEEHSFSGSERKAFQTVEKDAKQVDAGLGASFVQKKGITVIKDVFKFLRSGKYFDLAPVASFVQNLYYSCRDNEDQFVTLARLKDPDQYQYAHAFNVCIYSMAIGSRLQYDSQSVQYLGIAGLLHDVGEIKLPDVVLGKSRKYTTSEFSIMKKHPELGYELLKPIPGISEEVCLAVLHHHERLDGSGYPSGHLGRFIHPLGKIVALAEAYDAITSVRSNAESVTPTEAIKLLYAMSGKHFEPSVAKALVTLVGIYPMGSLLRLTGGALAVVLGKNKEDLSKPKVVVLTDQHGKKLSEPFILNLYGDPEKREVFMAENAYEYGIDPNKYIVDAILKGKQGC